MTLSNHNVPCRRSGAPLSGEEIAWLPPLKSLKASTAGDLFLTLGTVGELRKALENFQDSHTEEELDVGK